MRPGAHSGAVERPARSGGIPALTGTLLVVGLWLLARPYRGVRHDGILYLGQTLGRLFPQTIGRDLFLAFGSQDKYSVYSHLMAPLVQSLGVGLSQITMLLASQVLFLGAAWRLMRELPRPELRWGGMLALAVLPHTFGGLGSFSFAEPFLTARVLSEPFAMLALATLLQGRPLRALAWMVPSVLFHPLIALPALATLALYLALGDRRWAWLALLPVGAALAGAVGVAPFDGLWRQFDADWWSGVKIANTNAFVANQTLLDWAPALFDVAVVGLAARRLAGRPLGQLLRAVLWCELAFVIVWGVGADLLHDVLITQLQLWRVLWLSHLFCLLALPMLVSEAWQRGGTGRWFASALVLAALAVGGNWATGDLCLVWLLAAWAVDWRAPTVSAGLVRMAVAVSAALSLLITAVIVNSTVDAVDAAATRFGDVGLAQILAGTTLFGGALGGLLLAGLKRPGAVRAASTVLTLAVLAWGVSSWDQRSAWQRYLESGLSRPSPFAGRIPPGASVMWDTSLLDSWMLLQEPNWLSPEQSAGLLFNRGTAIEYLRRRQRLFKVDLQVELCQAVGAIVEGRQRTRGECPPQLETIAETCRGPGGPRFMIFESDNAQGAVASWHFSAPAERNALSFQLYDCALLSKAPLPPATAPASSSGVIVPANR